MGWGHSTTHHVMNLAARGRVKKLVFFHHEPTRTDNQLDVIVEHYRHKVLEKGMNLEVHAAIEGATIRF